MAKNRINQSAAIRFGPAIKALLLCVLIGGSGIGYVWQKKQIHELGTQSRSLEQRLDKLKIENAARRKQLDELQLPGNLERSASALKLGLVPATARQVVRLPEPLPEAPAAAAQPRIYAARPNGTAPP